MSDSILFKVDILATSVDGAHYDLTDSQLGQGAIAISNLIAARIQETIEIQVKVYVISYELGCIRCQIGVRFSYIKDYLVKFGKDTLKPNVLIPMLLSIVMSSSNISCTVNVNANEDPTTKEIDYNVLPLKTCSVLELIVEDGDGVSHVVERNIDSLRAHRPDLTKTDMINKLFSDNPSCFIKNDINRLKRDCKLEFIIDVS
ncbi:TPA: hypothetical protein ACVO3A_003403 [Vibrio diabolicus]